MSSKRVTTSLVAIAALALAATTETTEAFAPMVMVPRSHPLSTVRFAEETKESAFVPAENSAADDEESDEDVLSTVEMLGRGAAKVCFDLVFPTSFILKTTTGLRFIIFSFTENRPSVESAREDRRLLPLQRLPYR